MDDTAYILRYWGKAQPRAEHAPPWHPLAYHSLDVAACGWVLLGADTACRRRIAHLADLPDEVVPAWLSMLLALHDLGKFSDGFQSLRPDLLQALQGRTTRVRYTERHDTLGWVIAREELPRLLAGTTPDDDSWDLLAPWVAAVTGHHGRPPYLQASWSQEALLLKQQFPPAVCQDLRAFVREVVRLLLPNRLPFSVTSYNELLLPFRRTSWLAAGLAVTADWLGSNQQWFPYRETPALSLEQYWHTVALPQAATALRASGLAPAAAAPVQTVATLFAFETTQKTPTSLQQLADTLELAPGPQLIIIEEVTGGGKTEAALSLAARLLAMGTATGLYLALPTMATADAMHQRVARMYQRLFADDAAVSLVLAHSRAACSLALEQANHRDSSYGPQENDSASGHCSAWLADSRKKALLAHVGVGTIDQALLGILPARHQSLRLWGLLGKVLIVDEVHACEAYVMDLLKTLLTFHTAFGGTTILLSATLPQSQRAGLVGAFAEGVGLSAPAVTSMAYPLLTQVTPQADLHEIPVASRADVGRTVQVQTLAALPAVYTHIHAALQAGACVCWVRNTVADALDAYAQWTRVYGAERVVLYHARFALMDRLHIGDKVLRGFGPDSYAMERHGQLVIATQVVEQSLDVDFDYMVTDLAPLDLIIQRAGRLRRHARNVQGNPRQGKDQRGAVRLGVLMPVADAQPTARWYRDMFPRAAYVYSHHGQLWLTASWLQAHGAFTMPEQAREMIESVYGDAASAHIPEGLQRNAAAAEGDAMADRSMAALNRLSLAGGYEATSLHWHDDEHTPTRLGDPTTTVRLARFVDGQLTPWAMDATAHAWELSQVSVRTTLVDGESERYGAVLATAKDRMPDRGKYSVLVPLVAGLDGVWHGWARNARGDVLVTYSPLTGLQTEGETQDESAE